MAQSMATAPIDGTKVFLTDGESIAFAGWVEAEDAWCLEYAEIERQWTPIAFVPTGWSETFEGLAD